jgi:hypothetical protein
MPDVPPAVNRARVARGDEPLERGPSFWDPPSVADEELIDRIADKTVKGPRDRL